MIAARKPAIVVLFVGLLGLPIGTANAAISHKLLSTFGELTKPTDVTVAQSNGNVYVSDSGANVVDVFGAEGGAPTGNVPVQFSGAPKEFHFGGEEAQVAIDESSGVSKGDVYVGDTLHNVVDRLKLNTTTHEYEYICQFTGFGNGCLAEGGAASWVEPAGVAVDGEGNVYVASFRPEHGAVSEFSPEGADIKQLSGGDIGIGSEAGPFGLAVDPTGDLYVNNFHHAVVKVDSEGKESFLDQSGSTAVAVDPITGHVYVDDGTYIAEYTPEGQLSDKFGEGTIGHSEGVAVNGSTGDVYVSDQANRDVLMYGPSVTIPDVTTSIASNVSKTTATVSGTVDPVGAGETHYFFQYSTNPEYPGEETKETPEESAGSGSVGVPVSANLAELTPATTYHYRLVAKNTNGVPSFGKDEPFTTLPAVRLKTCPPIDLHGTSGMLCVLIDPEGLETSYSFQYALAGEEYSIFTPFENTGAGTEEKQFTASISELQPGTVYHYRVVAFNELGATFGKDEALTTPPAEPTVNDRPPFANGIAPHEATLHGIVNPGRGVTTYHFQYGISIEYGSSTPEAFTQLNYEDDEVEQLTTGLRPETTYHYRLVATNSSGTAFGPDKTFATLSSIPPTAIEANEPGEPSPLPATLAQPSTPVLLPIPVFPPEKRIEPPTVKCKRGFIKKSGKCVKKHRARTKQKKHKK